MGHGFHARQRPGKKRPEVQIALVSSWKDLSNTAMESNQIEHVRHRNEYHPKAIGWGTDCRTLEMSVEEVLGVHWNVEVFRRFCDTIWCMEISFEKVHRKEAMEYYDYCVEFIWVEKSVPLKVSLKLTTVLTIATYTHFRSLSCFSRITHSRFLSRLSSVTHSRSLTYSDFTHQSFSDSQLS